MTDVRELHAATSHAPDDVHAADVRDPATRPPSTKRYRDRPFVAFEGIAPPWDPALSLLTETRTDPLAGTSSTERESIDVETVATLCYEAMGITNEIDSDGQEHRFRAASCTGKLYHVECYVVCEALPGLEAGVYHFDPAGFGLDVLRRGDYRGVLAEAVGDSSTGDDPATRVSTAPVTVVTTSVWWRNAWKYADRTYRHAFWDSGTVLANLLACAHGLSLPAGVVTGFAADPVVDLLGLDPETEGTTAMVPIGEGSPIEGMTSAESTDSLVEPDDPSVEPIDPARVPESSGSVPVSNIADAWDASTLEDGEAATNWRRRVRESRGIGRVSAGSGRRIDLEPVDHETASARPLHPVVVRRGSCRTYATDGPSRRQVATVLDRATRGIPGDWNGGDSEHLAFLDVYVLCTAVDGIPDGSYHYHPGENELERLGAVDVETKTHVALDQSWAGDGHVNVYLLADVDRIVGTLGNRGYRLAQLEAGLTLGRLYLATYAHRTLGGLGLTFYDDPVTAHLSPRAADQNPMTLFAFGRKSVE
ncbi:SagB/ThcOx family dehydrogenase [Halovivax cerinus]|uniref:SagB/ThcOx family dehydrogenase n=1 Tax=Halovivax cerinus TaxID=1487865 RepID=A0ABD5NKE4_9EURY|nr:SagB/ThcOx family dehydrogenase [Halovivax cerinus]